MLIGIGLFFLANLGVSNQIVDPSCAPYVPSNYENTVSPSNDTIVNFDYTIVNVDDVDVGTYVSIVFKIDILLCMLL